MQNYLEILKDIIENGDDREDRTGDGTRGVFGRQLRFNLKEGFPLLTTKKMGFKSVYSELLWFLEGSTDERRLAEILYGTRDQSKTTIWSANANADYWAPKAKFPGDLGRVYGAQWRAWHSPYKTKLNHDKDLPSTYIDQIKNVVQSLKSDPWSRRHVVVTYNPGEIDHMALPPCHMFFQFYVSSNKKLSCHVYMRSCDAPLGLPYNIASYAALTHMVAHVTGMEVQDLVMSFGDIHIYSGQLETALEQIARSPLALPTIQIDKTVTEITDFTMASIDLLNYKPHPKLDYPFSV